MTSYDKGLSLADVNHQNILYPTKDFKLGLVDVRALITSSKKDTAIYYFKIGLF